MSSDEKYLRQAIQLALKAEGKTSPNPLVGAVVVKSGKVVGRGYHQRAGQAHAEILALRQAGKKARQATLYLNLEPCCHFGRTPPCVDKIAESGIKKVVISMPDPNPLVSGKGIRFLRKKGVKVKVGVLKKEALNLNAVFIKYITQSMPFVSVKVAESLDGKIASKSGDSKWISSFAARQFSQKLRAKVDAILVGKNTLLNDNPRLTNRLSGFQPYKVILDSRLEANPKAKIFLKHPEKVILATTNLASMRKRKLFQRLGTQVYLVKRKAGRVDLRDLMKKLAAREISHVLIEGGGETVASALKEKIVDRIFFFVAPKIIGGKSAPTAVAGEGIARLSQAIKVRDLQCEQIGNDYLFTGKI
jgi:diaminohydroxyphosphoribosylaminopyrimidine deaminase/5-amino-6-(5-phosphoribosylamino)uracil reductase